MTTYDLNLRSRLATSAVIARVKNFVREMPSCAAKTRARWCSAQEATKWNGLVACFCVTLFVRSGADIERIPLNLNLQHML
jgi:hypothetical protein